MEEQVENKEITTEKTVTQPEIKSEEETPEKINWRKFRQEREIDRKAKAEAEKRASEKAAEAEALKAALESIVNKPSAMMHNEYQQPIEESEDVRIQKKVDAAIAERDRRYIQEREQRERQEYPNKLAETFSDFNQVCSVDNLDYLEYHYPEIARAFRYAPDGFEKWADVYKAVKKFVPNTDSKKDQQKAEKNFVKPQSMAASGVSQTGDSAPLKMDDKRRSDNWARMQRVMKGG